MIELRIETELGELPASWHVGPLGEFLSKAQYGASVKGAASGGYPILRMTNQVNGRISPANIQYADLPVRELENFRVQRGDILFNRTNSFELVGRTAIFDLDGDYVFASYLIRLRTLEAVLDPFFLNAYLNAHGTQRRLKSIATRAVSQSNISATRLRGFVVPVPPLAEQRKIVGVLGLVQRAMEQQEGLIALTTELKKVLLHQLFTQGLRGEPQKQTEIGPIPENWDLVELGSLATKISKGSSPRWQGFEYLPEGVLFIRSQNVGSGRMEFADRVFLSSKFNEQEKRSILKDGDILVNLVGASIGRVALGTPAIEGANCNQAVGFVRLEQKRSFKEFIVNYLLSPTGQQQMFFQKKDIARANLSLLDLRTFKVPVPSPAEIDEIAALFTKIENKLDLCQRKHAALTALFRTLLHQFMTARIRVHDLELRTEQI